MQIPIIVANNQTIVAAAGTTSTITCDPIPLEGNDRWKAIVNVHVIFGTAPNDLEWGLEVSNDGTTWVPFGTADSRASSLQAPVISDRSSCSPTRLRTKCATWPTGTKSLTDRASSRAWSTGQGRKVLLIPQVNHRGVTASS